ncbi:serine hydrolase [Streptomyces sp. NPDC059740]|uniref:serine hydrolase n=1 Tax=Streptomyces sp. NPDC059740 TaxID=3346926 RepID=UPI003662A7D4
MTRRRLGASALTLAAAGALFAAVGGSATAAPAGGGDAPDSALFPRGARNTTLRRGSARQAGLLQGPLDQLVTDARKYLGPSPKHPYYPGAVMLAGRGGTIALEEAIGSAVRYSHYDEAKDVGVEFPADQQIAMAPDTVFDLASLSKLFTSLVAVGQIERGALGLERPAAAYLPQFAAHGKEAITVRQLLTHTSGLRPDLNFFERSTREEQLALLWDDTPQNPPGKVYLYSDLNMITLQLVLERVTGKGLDTLVREQVTAPLGMTATRYNPPADWKPRIAATEDQRKPWGQVDRGLVWGEVHDENSWALGGVAGHAGVFSSARDLAVLCRTLLNGGSYGRARILRPESVELMFTDFNTAFPGDAHGLGFELYQHWYMGAMATPHTAGHTGFTGTSVVLDPTTDSFLVLLSNAVHPCRNWRSGSAPRVATGTDMARAVPVRPEGGSAAWFAGMASAATATLTLPEVTPASGAPRLRCGLWWDTEPDSDAVFLEASTDAGASWHAVPFTTTPTGSRRAAPENHPGGSVTGFNGRQWQEVSADLTAWAAGPVRLRWRYTTDPLYVGRGVYVDRLRVEDGRHTLFDDRRPGDAGRVALQGWTPARD